MGKKGDHVSFYLRQGEQVLRTVAFGRRDLLAQLQERAGPRPGGPAGLEVAFLPRLNRWNGKTSVELELKEIRFPRLPEPAATGDPS